MPRTLLLADDSITIQKVVAITFAAEDFTVVAVDNGEDAYARARELRPAIIIADVSMPRRNGYELAHAVKSDPELRNTPVLLLAGTFEPLDPAKATASLANGHLVKPFDSQVLIDKVNELLGVAAPGAQAAVALPAPSPIPVARPVAQPQPFPAGAARPSMPAPLPTGAVPQRPVPLTQQPMARPPTAPFGIPAAPAAVAPPPAASRPPTAVPFQAPRAPLPLTSPFASAPSAVPAAVPTRPQVAAIPLVPQPTSPFSPPVAVPASPPAASPFPSVSAPRPAPSAPGPAVPAPFPRPAASPAGPPRPSPFPPASPPVPRAPAQAAAPAPSPTTDLWGTPPPTARPTAPMPIAPASFAAPRAPAPAVAPPAPLPLQAPRAPAPPQAPERRPGAYTPTWGEQSLGSMAAPVPAAPSAPAPQFDVELTHDLSAEVSGMAEAAAAASVQPAAGEISLDVPMDEETPALLPEIEGFELGGSQDLDISLTGGASPFISGALSDFAQQGGSTPTDGLEFDAGGSAEQPLELASPHEFLGGDVQTGEYAAEAFLTPAVAPPSRGASPPASAVAPQASSDGEAALRQALSQASREVIERVVWEVVPQLAEIILREHVARMEQQRSQG